jgi:hypothetical protein
MTSSIQEQASAVTAAANGEPYSKQALRDAAVSLGVIAECPDLFRAMVRFHRQAPVTDAIMREFPEAQLRSFK